MMRSHFQCVHVFHHCQLLTSLFSFGPGVLKAHRLCTSLFSGNKLDLEAESYQLHSKSLNFPTMYSQTRLHAHVSTRASFSICVDQVSVGVFTLDMNETGIHELSGWS